MSKSIIIYATIVLVGCAITSCSSAEANTSKTLFPTVKIEKTAQVFKQSDPFFRKPCQE